MRCNALLPGLNAHACIGVCPSAMLQHAALDRQLEAGEVAGSTPPSPQRMDISGRNAKNEGAGRGALG